MVPTDVQGELKHLYAAAGELLRHFWSCFPVNTPFLEEKVTNIHYIHIFHFLSEIDTFSVILTQKRRVHMYKLIHFIDKSFIRIIVWFKGAVYKFCLFDLRKNCFMTSSVESDITAPPLCVVLQLHV